MTAAGPRGKWERHLARPASTAERERLAAALAFIRAEVKRLRTGRVQYWLEAMPRT